MCIPNQSSHQIYNCQDKVNGRYRSATFVAKLLQVNERIQVKPLLEKQDVTQSDHTGTIRFTLWQNDIDSLKIDTLYKLVILLVQSYMNVKYLSHSMSGLEYHAVHVATVFQLNKLKGCVACKKEVELVSETLGQCVSLAPLPNRPKMAGTVPAERDLSRLCPD